MAGLNMRAIAGLGLFATVIIVSAASFTGCSPALDLKDFVQQKVTEANTHLKLVEISGPVEVPVNGTYTWPDTKLTDTIARTFQLSNTGDAAITLIGANPVAITGGSGQAAYGSVVQPVQLVLQPGDSTNFSVSFAPPAADTDYACNFVITSNDETNPAFKFYGQGHSTQWHGSKAIVSSPSAASPMIAYSNPKVVVLGSTIYLAYHKYVSGTASSSGIALTYSTDQGASWSSPLLVVPESSTLTVSGFSFAGSGSQGSGYRLHLFYLNSYATSPYLAYTTSYATPGSISFTSNYVGTFGYSSWQNSMVNDSIVVANGNVYVLACDNTSTSAPKLTLAVRGDSIPYMGTPSFSYYTITDASSHTGGFGASLKVNATNAYITYADAAVQRTCRVPLSTIGTPSSYVYSTVPGASTYNRNVASLFIDASKTRLLWSTASDFGIYYSESDLTMGSWSTAARLTGENVGSTLQLMEDGSDLYCLHVDYYTPYSIILNKSSDGGATWTSPSLDGPSSSLGGVYSSLAISGQSQYVAYSTGYGHANGYSITLTKSIDGGATW
jgi:hypothetical protein